MIPIGTVCYLTGDHSRAGQCCTVTGPEYMNSGSIRLATWADVPPGLRYPITLASGEPPPYGKWVASIAQLIPITPPGLTTDEDKRIPVAV